MVNILQDWQNHCQHVCSDCMYFKRGQICWQWNSHDKKRKKRSHLSDNITIKEMNTHLHTHTHTHSLSLSLSLSLYSDTERAHKISTITSRDYKPGGASNTLKTNRTAFKRAKENHLYPLSQVKQLEWLANPRNSCNELLSALWQWATTLALLQGTYLCKW